MKKKKKKKKKKYPNFFASKTVDSHKTEFPLINENPLNFSWAEGGSDNDTLFTWRSGFSLVKISSKHVTSSSPLCNKKKKKEM